MVRFSEIFFANLQKDQQLTVTDNIVYGSQKTKDRLDLRVH